MFCDVDLQKKFIRDRVRHDIGYIYENMSISAKSCVSIEDSESIINEICDMLDRLYFPFNPCPFCSSYPALITEHSISDVDFSDVNFYEIRCLSCSVSTNKSFNTHKEAIRFWNTRIKE
jgi:hypothetical protein